MNLRRLMVMSILCLYTFVVYRPSAPSINSSPRHPERFDIKASVSFTLFVMAYRVGLLLCSELLTAERNPINPDGPRHELPRTHGPSLSCRDVSALPVL
jgi:hypothetical protein